MLAFTGRAGFECRAPVFRTRVTVVAQQRNGVINLLLHREGMTTFPTVTQWETGLLQEIGLVPYRQLELLRQGDRRSWADFFTAGAENAAAQVKGPRQLSRRQIGCHA